MKNNFFCANAFTLNVTDCRFLDETDCQMSRIVQIDRSSDYGLSHVTNCVLLDWMLQNVMAYQGSTLSKGRGENQDHTMFWALCYTNSTLHIHTHGTCRSAISLSVFFLASSSIVLYRFSAVEGKMTSPVFQGMMLACVAVCTGKRKL